MIKRTRSRLLFVASAFSPLLTPTTSFGWPSPPPPTTTKKCVIKVCHNKDCCKKGGGEALLETFRDLIPPPSPGEASIAIESSGCLSQCGKGPNVLVVHNDDSEKMYFGVEDPMSASAVIDVATGEEYPINLLLAATYISQAEHVASPSKKESLLTSAISAVTDGEYETLLHSFAHAHALLLRADARLDLSPPNNDGAIADATRSSQISPAERKVWRVLESAHEAEGNVPEAIAAVREMARVDPAFATKAKRECARLEGLLP